MQSSFMTLILLCEKKGITTAGEAMQLAAQVTHGNFVEMERIRAEARILKVHDGEELSAIKRRIQERKVIHW